MNTQISGAGINKGRQQSTTLNRTTTPSWKNFGKQVDASRLLALKRGCTKEKPKEGNTFLVFFPRTTFYDPMYLLTKTPLLYH
ncbi:MAG: hypothetical protein LUQ04_10965 [Methanoregula sp.]|nr:hypothetical protein [Methanoregula sp.]